MESSFAVAVAGLLCFSIVSVSVSGDIGTAIAFDPPSIPTRCAGYGQPQFPEGGLYMIVSHQVWDNGAACRRRYLVKCIVGPCRGGSIEIPVVDVCQTNPCPTLTLSNKAFNAISMIPNAKIKVEYSLIGIPRRRLTSDAQLSATCPADLGPPWTRSLQSSLKLDPRLDPSQDIGEYLNCPSLTRLVSVQNTSARLDGRLNFGIIFK